MGAELLVALQMLGCEARPLGRQAVGEAQHRELLAEGSSSPGEPLGRVVGLGIAHETYLQVKRCQGRRQVRLPGREAEPAPDVPDHRRAERVVGDEEDPTLQLPAGHGLGHVV